MVVVNFENGKDTYKTVSDLWQWDYGQVLQLVGLSLPAAVEIHFSLQQSGGDAITRIGVTEDGVTTVGIPDSLLENAGKNTDYYIYAFVYVSDEESGETRCRISMHVKSRPKPKAYEKPEDTERPFQEVVAAVSGMASRAESAEKSAEAWTHGNAEYPERDEDNAEYYAKQAESFKNEAVSSAELSNNSAELANGYATSAGNSAYQAMQSALNAERAEEDAGSSAQRANDSDLSAAASAKSAAGHAVQTAEDRKQTAINAAKTNEDRAQTGLDREAVSADRKIVETASRTAETAAENAKRSEGIASDAASSANNSKEKASDSAEKAAASESNAKQYSEAADTAKTEAVAAGNRADEARDGAESARDNIQDSINGVAQEATGENILSLLQSMIPFLSAIAENAGKAGSLNGFGLNLNPDNSVAISYTDLESGELMDVCTLPKNTTLEAIATSIGEVNESLKMIAGETGESNGS